jgi:hypothetical protein
MAIHIDRIIANLVRERTQLLSRVVDIDDAIRQYSSAPTPVVLSKKKPRRVRRSRKS